VVNVRSWLYITVVLLLLPVLAGCGLNQKRFASDAYRVDLKIFSNNTCELSIDGHSIISRESSNTDIEPPFKVYEQYWECTGTVGKSKFINIVQIYSPGCRCENEVIQEPVSFVQTENKNLSQGKWQTYARGPGVTAKLRPLFWIATFYNPLIIHTYNFDILLDPKSEVFFSLTGIARRSIGPPG